MTAFQSLDIHLAREEEVFYELYASSQKHLSKITWHVFVGWLPLGGASCIINKITQYKIDYLIP